MTFHLAGIDADQLAVAFDDGVDHVNNGSSLPTHVEELVVEADVDSGHARNVTGGCYAFTAKRVEFLNDAHEEPGAPISCTALLICVICSGAGVHSAHQRWCLEWFPPIRILAQPVTDHEHHRRVNTQGQMRTADLDVLMSGFAVVDQRLGP